MHGSSVIGIVVILAGILAQAGFAAAEIAIARARPEATRGGRGAGGRI